MGVLESRWTRAEPELRVASVLLLVTIVVVLFGAYLASAGLGILVLLLMTPPVVRTCVATMRTRPHGQPTTALAKAGTVLASVVSVTATMVVLSVVIAIVILAYTAYCALQIAFLSFAVVALIAK